MFNLTVSEAHTFYVGQDGWLVHNGYEIVRKNNVPTIPKGSIPGAKFDIAGRVINQLSDPRMGSTKLSISDLQNLINNTDAQVVRDLKSGHVSIIQEVNDKLLRITVAGDEMKVISVGPIRPNQVANSLKNGTYALLRAGGCG